MPRRQRGHPGETEPPENTDHEGPAPADLLQMWITGRQPQTAATPETPQEPSAVEGEPGTDAEPAPEPDTGADQVQGWASFGHARTAEDVLERSEQKPWLDVLLGETATPPHPPAEPEKPALLRGLDHDEEPTEAAEREARDPDATAVWTLEDIDAYDDGDGDAEPLAVAEPEPIPELASIPLPEERPEPEPAPFAAPLTEAPAERVDIGWPEEPDDGWEDVPPPVGGQAAYIARWGSADDWQAEDWEPDKWQSTEPPIAEDPPVLEVAAPPVESTPEAAAPEPVDVLAEPVTPDQPSLFGEQVTEPDLPWDPDSTQDYDWTAVEHAEAAPVGDGAVVDVPAREEASPEAGPEAGPEPATGGNDHGPVIPEHVEYTRRASYRPLLGTLFVVAAVLAVVAIFWAVSQGGSSSIGIAIGVTAFALVFWWGLISWTPTVVSVDGPILEVMRGADGERFDLRDPDLDIDVDGDTASRSWRTTITRPDDTELVIPASAVDPHEFTAIVQHYRGQVEREDHPSR